jgi:hypothetical protein
MNQLSSQLYSIYDLIFAFSLGILSTVYGVLIIRALPKINWHKKYYEKDTTKVQQNLQPHVVVNDQSNS